jgi:hypothetical protein
MVNFIKVIEESKSKDISDSAMYKRVKDECNTINLLNKIQKNRKDGENN